MNEFVRFPRSPIASDGWVIVLVGLCASLIFGYVGWESGALWACLLGLLSLLFTVFSVWFFRDPVRVPASSDPSCVISGADGTVLKVETVNDPRYGEPSEKISIFMSPLNVHVNRAPIAGTVEKVEYVAGKFFNAATDKASLDNERNLVILRNDKGQRVAFLQIAGFIARRIVCHVKPGDRLGLGQRYGMIRFGSRMEIFVPVGSQVLAKPGQHVSAGQTIVARMPNA